MLATNFFMLHLQNGIFCEKIKSPAILRKPTTNKTINKTASKTFVTNKTTNETANKIFVINKTTNKMFVTNKITISRADKLIDYNMGIGVAHKVNFSQLLLVTKILLAVLLVVLLVVGLS